MISTKHAALAASISGAAASPVEAPTEPSTEPLTPSQQVAQSLEAAAAAAVFASLPLDEFMHRAWSAYVDARPGLREHLADAQLIQQIQDLRAAGKVAAA